MNDNILIRLGNKIKIERIKQGLSQEQLAHLADLNTRSISTLENGLNNIRYKTIQQISQALNLEKSKLAYIYGDIEMTDCFDKVKNYIYELGYKIDEECEKEELLIINEESKGIKNLIIDCEDPIIVIEQFIFELKKPTVEILQRLMQINRELVHGAFVLDEDKNKIIFRDTLRLSTLDIEELQASIDSLSMAMAEYSTEIIKFAKEAK